MLDQLFMVVRRVRRRNWSQTPRLRKNISNPFRAGTHLGSRLHSLICLERRRLLKAEQTMDLLALPLVVSTTATAQNLLRREQVPQIRY